jgi:hypothetical protein
MATPSSESPQGDAIAARIGAAYAELAQSRFGAAAQALQAIAADHPESYAAQHACGAVLCNLGAAPAAEPFLRRAHALNPGDPATRTALAFALLALGRYAEAWPLYEARHDLPGARPKPNLAFPEWRGEPLAGQRLLVWPDEGLGDQIQFLRFAQALERRGGEVALGCTGGVLERLFAANLSGYIFSLGLEVEFPQPDYWIMSSLLPDRLGLTPETAPQPPYLKAPGVRPIAGARIGVAAQGNPQHQNDRHRSLWPEQAARLLALPGAIGLQPEQTGAKDMAETAEIIAGLDLVISVDTSIAHLAAAMGRPTWILLPTIGLDWRWGFGARTPWYPAARLFRQPRINDWPAVVDSVIAALPGELAT